jgi:hypothetical protein
MADAKALAEVQEGHVHCERDELKKKITANRDQHVKDYEKAIIGWRTEFAKVMTAHAAECVTLANKVVDAPADKIEYKYADLPEKPENHVKDYDRIIARLSMEQETKIYLKHSDFNKYVLDEWRWKEAFTNSLSNYA